MAGEEANLLTLGWSRPGDPDQPPTVWGRHQFQDADGNTVHYRVQDATPDLHDKLLHYYSTEYLYDEPACRNLKLADDEVSKGEYSFLMAQALKQGVSVVVLEEPSAAGAEPEVVGAMILAVLSAEDPELPEFEGRCWRLLVSMLGALRSSPGCEPCTRPENPVSHYMADLGMWVRRDRRQRGLARCILKALMALCRSLGVPHFSTPFTGAVSQRTAKGLGFKEYGRLTYADWAGEDGQPAFHDMPEEHFMLLGFETKDLEEQES